MIIIKRIFEKSIQYIAEQQQKDGGFISSSSPIKDDFTHSFSYHTTFITAIILETLSYIDDTPLLYQIKKKAADFLMSQKTEQWSWNYWSNSSKEFISKPYPNDLDDTFCALNALFLFDKNLITGSAFAHIVQTLTAFEKNEGGPYKTWIVPQNTSGWDDVDIVVNSNIAYFLQMQQTTLPNLQLFFKERLQKNETKSPYYPSLYPFLYFLSRFYTDKKIIENKLINKRNKQGYWENPLYTSLAILALLKSNFPPEKLEKSIVYLLGQQKKYHWQAYAFCIDPTKKNKTYYAGSQALTTAFSLAAISLYMKRIDEIKLQKKTNKESNYIKKILDGKSLQFDNKELSEVGGLLLPKIMSKDSARQIPLMPYYFSKTLNKKAKNLRQKDIILLCEANVLGWLAYTIYDDFLDEEGQPKLLPLANSYLRRLTHIFDTAFVKQASVSPFFHHVLDSIEEANFWEISHCRLPVINDVITVDNVILPDFKNLEQLAHKSLGHSLGPLTILLLLGYKQKDKEFISLYQFFIHYLIAKQLHDDAHDWEEDLSKGQVSFVVALLLKKAKKKKIITTNKVDIKKNIPKLQKLFWYEIIEEICSEIYKQIEKAHQKLESSSVISNKEILENLLTIYQAGADKALEERKKTMDFLKTY